MLKMNAHNSKLTLALTKLHDQVNDMQNALMQKEEELERTRAELDAKVKASEGALEKKEKIIVEMFKEKRELEKQLKVANEKAGVGVGVGGRDRGHDGNGTNVSFLDAKAQLLASPKQSEDGGTNTKTKLQPEEFAMKTNTEEEHNDVNGEVTH